MIQYLLSIDPGKTTGWGYFQDGVLHRAGKSDPLKEAPGISEGVVVIENPRWYPHERRIDVNDLLDLAVMVGRYAGRFEICNEVELVWPRTWKGTLDWRICCERVLAALRPEEVAVLPRRPRAKDVDHNILDGVGLGLWKLQRL